MIDSPLKTPIDLSSDSVSPNEPEPAVNALRNAPPPAWLGTLLKWIFPIAGVLFIALIAIPGFLEKWLWMRQLDYVGIFWTLFSVKVTMAGAGFVCALLFLAARRWLVLKLRRQPVPPGNPLKPDRKPLLLPATS
jgi:hypothetical protein